MDLLADITVLKQKILPDRILVFQHEFDLRKRDALKPSAGDIAYRMNTLENELNSKATAAYFKNFDVDTQTKTDQEIADYMQSVRVRYFG